MPLTGQLQPALSPALAGSTMDRYELLSELGDGSFGRVVKARFKSPREDDEGVVAIKQLKQRFQSFDSVVLLKEVQSLQVMSHPNIVPLLEVIREQDGQLFFVFEYMGGGSLYDLLKESIDDKASRGSNRLSASRTRDFVKQLLRGLAYIHEKGYSHRDLKPENLLLDEARETLKIADFGLCKKLGPAKMTFYVSTRWYRAPEVMLYLDYGTPIDVFATGLIWIELLSLCPMFAGRNEVDQLVIMINELGPPSEKSWPQGLESMKRLNLRFAQSNPQEGGSDSDLAKDAIRKRVPHESDDTICAIASMIQWSPLRRPTAEEALKKPIFSTSSGLARPKEKIRSKSSPPLISRQSEAFNPFMEDHPKDLLDGAHEGSTNSYTRQVPIFKRSSYQGKKTAEQHNEFESYLSSLSQADSSRMADRRDRDPYPSRKCEGTHHKSGGLPANNDGENVVHSPNLATPGRRRGIGRVMNSSQRWAAAAKPTVKKKWRNQGKSTGRDKPRWLNSRNLGSKRALEVHCSLSSMRQAAAPPPEDAETANGQQPPRPQQEYIEESGDPFTLLDGM